MIEPLEVYPCKDQYGNIYGEVLPSDYEIMRKINEIIEVLNKLMEKNGTE